MEDTLRKMAARRKATRAKTQCKYAAKRKKKGIPTSDDLARAMLKGFQEVVAADSKAGIKKQWAPLARAAIRHLEARGFDREQAKDRLLRTLRARGQPLTFSSAC